jgi:hypothetical protein
VIDSSAARGESHFFVNGTSAPQGSETILSLYGGAGLNTFNVKAAKSTVAIDGAGGPSVLSLTDAGGTSNINGVVDVRDTDGHPIDINVDGSTNPGNQPWIWGDLRIMVRLARPSSSASAMKAFWCLTRAWFAAYRSRPR